MKKILLACLLLNFITVYSAEVRDRQNETRTAFYVYPAALETEQRTDLVQEEIQGAAETGGAGGAVLGIIAGGAVAGIPGAIVGGAAGGIAGAHGGACCRKKTVYKDIDWIESSGLDLVFYTKQREDVIYHLMIRLRPVPPGWRNSINDKKKSFKSKVEVFSKVDNKDIYSVLFPGERLVDIENSLSLPQAAGCCRFLTCCASNDSFMELSTKHRNEDDERSLRRDSVFEGTLSEGISIGEILRTVEQMRINGKFPACSWSGKVKKCCRREKDVLNPTIFTYTLLHKLNAFGAISKEELLTNFLGATPIVRVQAVKNVRTRAPNGIRINETRVEQLIESSAEDNGNRL